MHMFFMVRVNRLADGWAFVKGELLRVASRQRVCRLFLFYLAGPSQGSVSDAL
jgi:hypothetical protein